MKSFLGLAVAMLLAVSVLVVAAPDAAQARGVHRSKMEAIKVNADKGLILVEQKKEKEPNKRQWKQLYKHAMDNSLLAAYYLQVLQQGEEVFEDDANACDFVARMVFSAVGFISVGQFDRANDVIGRIEVRMGNLPIARAAAVIQIKIDFKHASFNEKDARRILVINTRKNDGKVIIVVPGGGDNNGGRNDNGGGNNDNSGGGDDGDDDDDQDVDCKETAKVEISRACDNGNQTAKTEVTVTCKNRTYKVTKIIIIGSCCVINADCHEFDCMTGECRQGVCWYTKIINPSPATPQCMK